MIHLLQSPDSQPYLQSAPKTTSLLKRWRSWRAMMAKSLSTVVSCRNGEATESSVEAAVTVESEPSHLSMASLLLERWFRTVPYNLEIN